MKLLTRIRLVNWHLFNDCTIACNGTTYFIGANGVGKSTILDAIQFAMVGGQREVRFNQAALSGSKRTLASYVRGELGTEGQKFLRGDTTGVVALEFQNTDQSYFVHGAVIDAFEDNRSPDVMYFLVHNARLDDAWFFKTQGQLFDTRAFKRHLEQFALPGEARAQIFNRLEDYRVHLLNRYGQLKESYPAKIVKGLAFTPLTDIRSFVHNYLLDENLVDVRTLQEQLDTLHHFETLAANVRQRIGELSKIAELDQERMTQQRLRVTNGYIRRLAQAEVRSGELKLRRLELDEKRIQQKRLELRRDALADQLRHAQMVELEARVALQTNAAAQRKRELQQKLEALQAELRRLQTQEHTAQTRMESERTSVLGLMQILEAEEQKIPAPLQNFVQNADAQKNITPLQNTLEALGQAATAELALVEDRARLLREEAASIEREIARLYTGDRETSYDAASPEASRLRRLLRTQLGLAADELPFLCMTLQIADEAWQDAVEGALGRNRFTVLVPPEMYSDAARLYQEYRFKENLHGVGLLDAGRLLQQAALPMPNSLAEEVQTQNAAARAYVDLLLGNLQKCATLDELRQQRTGITRDCFLRRNFTISHMDPHIYHQWFIGKRSAMRQIQQRQARLAEIAGEMQALNSRDQSLRQRLAATRERVRPLIELEHILLELEKLPEVLTAVQNIQQELATLDVRNLPELENEIERCAAETRRLQGESDQTNRQSGSLEAQVFNLDTEVLPVLEKEIAQAMMVAQAFVQAEQVEPAQVDDMEKEYHRRCERQPVDVICQKAAEYEHDYTVAENRSRDRLREAKQAYSLRYDFGYDSDEDAARYSKECEKLTASELPEYEERIARQRSMAEQELVENFIHRLREQIEDAKTQLSYLNHTLSALRFGGERFEFISQPNPELRQVYDMIMDSQSVLGTALFESDFRQRHQQGWDLLFERLTMHKDDADNHELRVLQDYRNYLEYDIRLNYPNGDRALLSKINTKKSGGETTTPFYVAMVASFAQAYRLNSARPSDTVRLAMFDEAFSKMDTARTASVLQFMRETGLQVILATPPDKAGALLPAVDCVRTVVKKDQSAFVVEIDKEKFLEKLDHEQSASI